MVILKSDLSLGSCLSGMYASLYAVTKLTDIVAYVLLACPCSYDMLNKSFKPLALWENVEFPSAHKLCTSIHINKTRMSRESNGV